MVKKLNLFIGFHFFTLVLFGQQLTLNNQVFELKNVTGAIIDFQGEKVLKIERDLNAIPFDANRLEATVDEPHYARLTNLDFENGTIEVKMYSQIQNPSPFAAAQGFIGLFFRVDEADKNFESIYLRPGVGRSNDQFRRNRAVQYFAYPDHKFETLRKKAAGKYEGAAPVALHEWITMRIEVNGTKAEMFINDAQYSTFVVDSLLGKTTHGAVGLYVDIGTVGYFKDLKVTPRPAIQDGHIYVNPRTGNDAHIVLENSGGQAIAYSPKSNVKILEISGLKFKDLNKNGQLDRYEDWRLTADERAENLASIMTIEQIAGLMLYSRHQSIPARGRGYFAGTYGGKTFEESGAAVYELSDQQKAFLEKDNLRHVLLTTIKSPEAAAKWNNNMQAFCEGIGLGIPANNSSDPRHGTVANAEYNAGAGGSISMWPGSLGMAATFDPKLTERFGQVVAAEYRALGIATALSPQVDIATEPRWLRFNGTYGENPYLSAAMAEAYCNGIQTSKGALEIKDGWGYGSVNAMVKHWPGGGSGEGGRDAHYGCGQYAVYPKGKFTMHFIPFVQGAFKLKGKTKMASAVMPYYTISWNQDTKNKENVANNYNQYIIQDLLRNKYKYDGVVCTDWIVAAKRKQEDNFIDGKSFGVENLSLADLHYKVLKAGVDQFGGNNEAAPIIEAYQMGCKEIGEKAMRQRMEQSAVRLLKNIFRVGLFENPYLDPAETKATVGNPDFMNEGYQAQLKSMVLLKNRNKTLPLAEGKKVYVPKKFTPAGRNFLGVPTPETFDYPISIDIVKKYFTVVETPEAADCALVFIESPKSGIGYDSTDIRNGGNGYVPISLQYKDYTATDARAVSIAGGDPLEQTANRSYKDKTVHTTNATDLEMITQTAAKMKGKPVVVSILTNNPLVFHEFEQVSDAILLNFGVQDQVILETITGKNEPSGLLPFQMPANMRAVEKQAEDAPSDMDCHKDSEGSVYDFGFGMNWKGKIRDGRAAKFKK